MGVQLTPLRQIENFGKPYVIAEIGANHNGDMVLAKEMIKAAKRAGANCVKFQSWSPETIFSEKVYEQNYFLKDDYRDRSDTTLREIVSDYAITEQQLFEMKKCCDNVGIDCISTAFSEKEFDFLVDELKAPFVKVASMDLNNYPLLTYFAKKNVPLVLSLGLSEFHEIDKAVRILEDNGCKKIILLHCVSIYPPEDNQVNLRNIETLQRAYPDYPIGFSDHSLGTCLPVSSIALGVPVIEKHFTLDKDMVGWDHKVSADEAELTEICENVQRVYEAIGTHRISAVESKERKDAFRRSLVLNKSLKKGERITKDDLTSKRPGDGLKPELFEFVVGRTLARNLEADSQLRIDDFV